MRDLTQQEIDDAPARFDSYYEDGHGNLRLINTGILITQGIDVFESCSVRLLPKIAGVNYFTKDHYSMMTCKPIPRKEFDISEYEFSDGDIMVITKASSSIEIRSNNTAGVHLSRQDSIAIAKHFKLTAEDLK